MYISIGEILEKTAETFKSAFMLQQSDENIEV